MSQHLKCDDALTRAAWILSRHILSPCLEISMWIMMVASGFLLRRGRP